MNSIELSQVVKITRDEIGLLVCDYSGVFSGLFKFVPETREKYFAHFENSEMRIASFISQRDKKCSF